MAFAMTVAPDVSGFSIDWPGLVELIRGERRDAVVLFVQASIDFAVAHPVLAAPFIAILVIRRRRQFARTLFRVGEALVNAWLDR